jgi:hypothetical protein
VKPKSFETLSEFSPHFYLGVEVDYLPPQSSIHKNNSFTVAEDIAVTLHSDEEFFLIFSPQD